MSQPLADHRRPERRALDERIAAEPPLPPAELPSGATPRPVEAFGVGPRYNGAGPTPNAGGRPVTLNLELDEEFAEVLAEEAARKKMSLPDYAVYLLMTTVPPPPPLKTGADVVAYWESEGIIGSRPDITDPEAYSQAMRARSNAPRNRE